MGEIAVRIARTAARLGIETVGVYSEPDANALHVDSVDVAVALGGSTPTESYLRGDAIIAAAVRTGADAIHPGYGFLAENAEFAQAVIDAGIVWVGPTPEQIRLLGDKVAAKNSAIAAGVPTSPIHEIVDGAVPDGVSFPALVKAAAGGGGRGMRIVQVGRRVGGSDRGVVARGPVGVRRRHRVRRGVHRTWSTRRGPDHGRHARQRDPSRRTGVLDPAPQPEGDRGIAVSGDHR